MKQFSSAMKAHPQISPLPFLFLDCPKHPRYVVKVSHWGISWMLFCRLLHLGMKAKQYREQLFKKELVIACKNPKKGRSPKLYVGSLHEELNILYFIL